ncbi:hypothetical protein EDB89DRAFT_1906499 [Lactarius sanguifluus]|nr:hypothetical protein EDB89DRAFT_1906499 [Lactarius sanguifluus]
MHVRAGAWGTGVVWKWLWRRQGLVGATMGYGPCARGEVAVTAVAVDTVPQRFKTKGKKGKKKKKLGASRRVLVSASTRRVFRTDTRTRAASTCLSREYSRVHLDRTTNYDYDNTPQVRRRSFELHELQPSPSSSHDYDTSNTGSNGARRRRRRNHDGPVSIDHDHDWAMPVDHDSDHGSIPIDYDNEEMPVDLRRRGDGQQQGRPRG